MYRNSGNGINYPHQETGGPIDGVNNRNMYYNKRGKRESHEYGQRVGDVNRNDPIFDNGPDVDNFRGERDGWNSNFHKRSHERGDTRYHGNRHRDRGFNQVNVSREIDYQSNSRMPQRGRSRTPRERSKTPKKRRKSRSSSRHKQDKPLLYDALPGIRQSAGRSRSVTPRRSLSKRRASETSSDSSSSESESGIAKKNSLGDDFFKSMYSRAKEDVREDVAKKKSFEKQLLEPPNEQIFPSSQTTLNVPIAINDEESYLYGRNQKEHNTSLQKDLNTLASSDPKVTPGGFDSNALQNVLKAIGFNFEMSAQSQQKFLKDAAGGIFEEMQTAHHTPVRASNRDLPIAEPLQETVDNHYDHTTSHETPNTKKKYSPYTQVAISKMLNNPPKRAPTNLYTQSRIYDQHEISNLDIRSRPLPTSKQDPPRRKNFMSNTIPVHLERKSSNDSQSRHVEEGAMIGQWPTTSSAPQTEFIPASVDPQADARKKRLDYLENTLQKLKNQQSDLFRKKRKEFSGHSSPLITKNNMLQAEVENEIHKIRKVAEAAAGIVSDDGEKIGFEFFDPGNHWCKLCNVVCSNLYDYLTHLHSKPHRKVIDPYDRPWMSHGKEEKNPKPIRTIVAPIKGTAFLLPVAGYYCSLCDMFSGDHTCAEDHCKTEKHNESFKKYCKNNPTYEERRKLDMAAALSITNTNSRKPKSDRNHEKNRSSRDKSKSKKHRKSSHESTEEHSRSPSPKTKKKNTPAREVKTSKPRKSRWSPGYDEFEKMQNSSTRLSDVPVPPKTLQSKRWDDDITGTVDMEIDDTSTMTSHKINLSNDGLQRHETLTTVVPNTPNQKSKIAIPFSVNKPEKVIRSRAESTSSTKSSESTDRKVITKEKTKTDSSESKLTAEYVRKQNALRAKLSAITVPSSRTNKKSVGLKRPLTSTPQNIKFKAIVKQREELAKVAQKTWSQNFSAFGGMVQYNYSMMSQSPILPTPQGNFTEVSNIPPNTPSTSSSSLQGVEGSTPEKTVEPQPEMMKLQEQIAEEQKDKVVNQENKVEKNQSIIDDDTEPPPPGEDGFDVGDDSASDASGISMEIASDED